MAWCLTAPSHYLNQCWLFIRSWEALKIQTSKTRLKILKLCPDLPGANELIMLYPMKPACGFIMLCFVFLAPWDQGGFKNAYDLVIWEPVNLHSSTKYTSFNVWANNLCGISKSTFEIVHKISYPYIERYNLYTILKSWELSDLRARMRFWKAPWLIMTYFCSIHTLRQRQNDCHFGDIIKPFFFYENCI